MSSDGRGLTTVQWEVIEALNAAYQRAEDCFASAEDARWFRRAIRILDKALLAEPLLQSLQSLHQHKCDTPFDSTADEEAG